MKPKDRLTALLYSLLLLLFIQCGQKQQEYQANSSLPQSLQFSDEALLDTLQYQTFQYFWEGAEPTSGMARERIHLDNVYPQNDQNVITLGGSGFGVMAILVGIERNFITREEGFERLNKIVDYLARADRFHGCLAPIGWKAKPAR